MFFSQACHDGPGDRHDPLCRRGRPDQNLGADQAIFGGKKNAFSQDLNEDIFRWHDVCFRPRSQACRRRRTACWRRCAEGSERSAGPSSFQIWRRWKSYYWKLLKMPLHQQRGWECCAAMNDIEPRLDGSIHSDSLHCLMVSLSLNWLLTAETEVSDPHCKETRWRTQNLYHCSPARGTNTSSRKIPNVESSGFSYLHETFAIFRW